MVVWPSNLPLPKLKTHSLDPQSRVIASKMDSGFQRLRCRRVNPPIKMTVSWLLSDIEIEFFDGWINKAIHGGAARFYFPVRTYSGLVNCRCYFLPSSTLYRAVFKGAGCWDVSANLMVENMPILSSSELFNMSVDGNADSAHFILRHVINQRMPLMED